MKPSRLSFIAVLLNVVALIAQSSGTPQFQYERTVTVAAAGPQRIDIDVPLLVGSRSFNVVRRGDRAIAVNGLGDLRLFANGVDVPYLLIPPSADEPAFVSGRILPITAIDLKENRSSGFEVDLLDVMNVDAIDLDAFGGPFLKRFRLEGSGDRERWTQLIGEGTAFSLPAEGIRHTRIVFIPGAYRYLRVTWNDTNSARLPSPPRALVRRVTEGSPGPILRTDVPITRRPSEPGRSRFRITLPAARLPIVALELNVGGGNLLRDARVFEPGLVGQEAQPRLLGQARLTRVVRDEIPADALSIPINQPAEPQLELVVDDGDNPPLELNSVTAVFAELPWIYFEAPAGSVTAKYGEPRLGAPRYDLEAARATIVPPANRAVWATAAPTSLNIEPEGLPMPDTGSAISTEGFGFARDIPEGAAGLIAVPLDAAVMAHSGASPRRLRDVRVVDRAGMQIPYLLERHDEPLIVETPIERRGLPEGVQAGSKKSTSYAIHPPFPDLPNARLVLTTRARVFQRSVTLGTIVKASDRLPSRFVPLNANEWVHADEGAAAPSLMFPLPEKAPGDLFLIVEEGDNQPLPIEKATILMPAYSIRLFRRPSLPLRLIYGSDTVGAPQYDLQLLAPQVLGRSAEEVSAGPERALGASGNDSSTELVSPIVFWSALGVTVVVLLGLVVRLMKSEPS